MDSNSTLVPNPQSSSRKKEGCRVKGDHFAMATYNDNISESDLCITYPALPRSRQRIDTRIAALPDDKKEQRPESFTTAWLYRARSHERAIPGRHLGR
jgi:hypothetical protein